MSKFIFSDETDIALIEDLVDALKRRGFDPKLRRGYVLTIEDNLDAYDVKITLDVIDNMVGLDFVDTLIINR